MDLQAQLNQAVALRQQGDTARCEPIFRRLLELRPGHPLICFMLAGIREELGDHAEALRFAEVARRAKPDNLGAMLVTANALQGLGRYAEAVALYDKIVARDPKNADVFNNRGNALAAMNANEAALASLDAALALAPGRAMFWYNRGNLLMKLRQQARAVEDFSRAIDLQPGFTPATGNRGILLVEMGQFELALADHDAVLALQPRNPHAHVNRGAALMHLGRHDEALAAYDTALAIDPHLPRMIGQMAIAAMQECDWPRMAAMMEPYRQAVRNNADGLDPLTLVNYGGDPQLMLTCAIKALAEKMPGPRPAPLWTGQRYAHGRLRIAYVSSDFHDHPVGFLLAPLLERHDRTKFEIIIVSTGQADGGTVRRRVLAACDQFLDVGETSDRDVAEKMRALEVDIAIDLNGHTYGARPGIFAFRPAPVQASWLGYPGTTGADFIDYIIADAVVAPPEQQPFYSEKIAPLPGCYFPFNSDREIAATPSRAEEGLPESGFVFCCFNRNWKFSQPLFDIWMRLLTAVPDSVLWLSDAKPHIRQKLRDQAQARGVDGNRLVFTQKRPIAEHLARHRLADLFLDILPYNAHATAADALLAGLPVLTQIGGIFASRVGASMLIAAGLPELVTHTAEEFEQTALALARDPARLAALREKLMRREGPLFDGAGFVRGLEAQYLRLSGAQ